ncbi:alanine racemase [Chromatiaceae bacterium AAb-1]|nr:alanine racemase [Chromatiaceae bacterium AAb-1]
MFRRPQARIDLAALQHNFEQVQKIAPHSKIMAVLKANAYGHGMLQVAGQLKSANAFGVARIDEALSLRAGGVVKPIVLLEGFFHADELPQIVASNLQIVVHQMEQVQALLNAQLDSPVRVWLKIDSGMHRLGLNETEFPQAWQLLSQSPNVVQPMRLMSHFACADERNSGITEQQLTCFNQLTANIDAEVALANSAAILAWPKTRTEWVRPGLMLYGVSPVAGQRAAQYGLKPVMTLSSSVIAVRSVRQGDKVGYGASWCAPADTRLAVVAIGYGDGYPRAAGNIASVLINQQRYPVVGRVSMDMLTVDIGVADINVGDQVILWGGDLPVEEIAEQINTIPYELLCNITSRVQFSYINAG